VLRGLTVADRDLRWSEWVRTTNAPGWPQRIGVIQRDVQAAARAWRESGVRDDADRLLAVWISWLLTTTDRSVRDNATEALYQFGRGDPRYLFDMTTSHLDLDDPYVSERMLAACYGVIMANQRPVDTGFEGAYHCYLSALGTAMCGPAATHPTSHILARSYAMGSHMMAKILYPAIADGVKDEWSDSFASTPAPRGIRETSKRGEEVQRALRMDFENYTTAPTTIGLTLDTAKVSRRFADAFGNSDGGRTAFKNWTTAWAKSSGGADEKTGPTASTVMGRSTDGSHITNLQDGSKTARNCRATQLNT